MKRYLILIVAVILILTSGLVVSCSSDRQEEPAPEFDKQVVFQKVDNLQVESYLRQQSINSKIIDFQESLIQYSTPDCVSELQEQLAFLTKQYQQLQEMKYDPTPEELDGLLTANLAEQQRLRTAVETNEDRILEAEAADIPPPAWLVPTWTAQNRLMGEQLEFLTKQYQELEELGDFLLE